MRTPNSKCCVCEKPLYRRPSDLKKSRHVACMEHRAEAQKLSGITEKQKSGLAKGRRKGTNNRTGFTHDSATKEKITASIKAWCEQNQEKITERGAKTRGENHYNWKGGSSRLNVSIRQMNENRRWMDAVKERDGWVCVECGSAENVESHHIIPLAYLVSANGIRNRQDARNCLALWDLNNGKTLCEKCHYEIHGRRHAD